MSFLAWAFALGGLAIVFPIVFHLIRPTPKGSQKFSSLMFLRQSPPRITKRTRIDHWLLLFMRALVVLLLVAAFMRPFVRTGGQIFVNDLPGNRVAILVDKSASTQRGDLWDQAKSEIDETLSELESGDDVALFAFDRQLQTVIGFSEDKAVDLESRKQLIRDQFRTIQPGWFNTDMGNALASTADFVSELEESRRAETGLQIVLISDMQDGADLGGLQTYVWPEDVRVDIRTVQSDRSSNAVTRVLPEEATSALDSGSRVRVTNSSDSDAESFEVVWQDATGRRDEESRTGFYVPPGTSQVLRVPNPASITADRLVVTGDDDNFDNQFFVTNQSQQQVSIAYFGSDHPDDAKDLLYFLQRVIPDSRARMVSVDQYSLKDQEPWKDGLTPRLAVVAAPVSQTVADQLKQFVAEGGLLLAVVTDAATLGTLNEMLASVSVGEATSKRDGYVMFGSIDFSHPLFRPLSGPRFNDFTNIRFWKHLPVTVDETDESTSVIARFDDDTVAIWQSRVGNGTVIAMSTSWRPDESQLALSTKFVPLITSLLGMTDRSEAMAGSWLVGDVIQLPESTATWTMKRLDGQEVKVDDVTVAEPFDQPGVYEFRSGDQQFRVAVNLHPAESQTAAVDSARLESFDVRIGTQPSRAELAGSLQKLKDSQLEKSQRIWKWLLLAAICLLVLETLLAGKRQNQNIFSEAAA